MLLRENLGWRHDGGLYTAGNGLQACDRRNDGLARAHVALDQAHHRVGFREIGQDVVDDARLCAGQRKWQIVNERRNALLAIRQRGRPLRLGKRAQAAQAQVVR